MVKILSSENKIPEEYANRLDNLPSKMCGTVSSRCVSFFLISVF